MTGVSPALPETKARNGAEPLTTRTNYKYHTTKVIKKIQTKKHISNKLSHPPPSLVIIKIHSRLPREGGGTGGKGEKGKKGSVGGGLSKAQRKNKTNNPVKVGSCCRVAAPMGVRGRVAAVG